MAKDTAVTKYQRLMTHAARPVPVPARALILPALALYGVFVLSPYAQAFYLSLTDWTGVSGRR